LTWPIVPLAHEPAASPYAGAGGGDVILTLGSDEKAGGDYGASWLVDEHPERIRARLNPGPRGYNV